MKYVIANWKMHPPDRRQTVALLGAIRAGLRRRAEGGATLPLVIICPPFVWLAPMRRHMDRRLLVLGAQNCHWELEGPYTGEVSAAMLRGLADYVLLGHRERRAIGETDEQIARKVAAASSCGIVPVLFVGEDHRGDDAIASSGERLRRGLSRIDPEMQRVVVVYEPAWAIGADEPADLEHVRAVAGHLKTLLGHMGVSLPEVLYGGAVTSHNVDRFAGLGILEGVGATRAALEAGAFLAMIDRTNSRCPPRSASGEMPERSPL